MLHIDAGLCTEREGTRTSRARGAWAVMSQETGAEGAGDCATAGARLWGGAARVSGNRFIYWFPGLDSNCCINF